MRDIVDIYRTIGLSRHDCGKTSRNFAKMLIKCGQSRFRISRERRDRVKRASRLRSNIASIKGQIGDRLDDEELEGISGKNLTQQMRMLKKVEDEKKHMRASMITDLNAAIQQVNQYQQAASMEEIFERQWRKLLTASLVRQMPSIALTCCRPQTKRRPI